MRLEFLQLLAPGTCRWCRAGCIFRAPEFPRPAARSPDTAAARRRRSKPWARRIRPRLSGTARATSARGCVDSYSRMRPQPVQVRLQACSGSSIITSGNRLLIMGCGLRSPLHRGNLRMDDLERIRRIVRAAQILLPLRLRVESYSWRCRSPYRRPAKAELSCTVCSVLTLSRFQVAGQRQHRKRMAIIGDTSGRTRPGIRCRWINPHPSLRRSAAFPSDIRCLCAGCCWWCRRPRADPESPRRSAKACCAPERRCAGRSWRSFRPSRRRRSESTAAIRRRAECRLRDRSRPRPAIRAAPGTCRKYSRRPSARTSFRRLPACASDIRRRAGSPDDRARTPDAISPSSTRPVISGQVGSSMAL